MILDHNSSYQALNNKLYGQTAQTKAVMRAIIKRLKNSDFLHSSAVNRQLGDSMLLQQSAVMTANKPYTIVVIGPKGAGKSLFIRNVLINLKQLELLVV